MYNTRVKQKQKGKTMEIKTYIDAWFKSEKDRVISLLKEKTENVKNEIKVKEKDLWTGICEKVLKHMEYNDIEYDSSAKTVYYNGYYANVWTFADNGVIYKFRKEFVSSNEGYTRYKFTMSGYYPSDTEKDTVIGFEETFDADDRNERKFNSKVTNAVIDLIEDIEDYTNKRNAGVYELNSLKKLNKLIEKIKG